MTRFIALIGLCLLPLAASAQDNTSTDPVDDRGRLVKFIEEKLSGAGRDIRIEGFKGALSSKATLDRLTIADDDGIWFTLHDAELDWNRAAVLRGKIDITKISAGEIELSRLPISQPSSPSAEAKAFALPDLPISINIGAIQSDLVRLGAPILGLGEPIDLSVTGTAFLGDGSFSSQLTIDRLTGPSGHFGVSASYDDETTIFDLDLALNEASGGMVTQLISLPDSPPMSLSIKGSGPVGTFMSKLLLTTDGHERLGGTVSINALPNSTDNATDIDQGILKGHQFNAALSGDLRPLFAEQYDAFFGRQSSLDVQGVRLETGQVSLDNFALSTQSIDLIGSAIIAADGLPEAFDIHGSLQGLNGEKVTLPASGPTIKIDKISLAAQYDRSQNNTWTLAANLNDFDRDGVTIGQVDLSGTGEISRPEMGQDSQSKTGDVAELLRAVNGDITTQISGLSLPDSALQSAIGTHISLKTNLSWRDGNPLSLQSLALRTDTVELTGSGTLGDLDNGLPFDGFFNATLPNLQVFSGLSGQDLSGNLQAAASGQIHLLDGRVDLILSAKGNGLSTGIPTLDGLTKGNSSVDISLKRDTDGLTLRQAKITTDAPLEIEATGHLGTSSSQLNITTHLADVAHLGVGLSGPLSANATIERSTENTPWQIASQISGPSGSSASVNGQIESAAQANLSVSGTAPLGLANSFTQSLLLQGTARFDLGLSGPLALSSVSGNMTILPGTSAVVPAASLAFTVDQGQILLNGENANIDLKTTSRDGGSVDITGSAILNENLPINLAIVVKNLTLEEPSLYTTSLSGSLQATGNTTGGAHVSGALSLGETQVSISSTTAGTGTDFFDITHRGATGNTQTTRARAGLISTSNSSGSSAIYGLDIAIDAAQKIFIRGRGLDAEVGGQLTLKGSTGNIIPTGEFPLIRGRLTLLGQRLEMSEGSLSLYGDLDPTLNLIATTQTDDLSITVTISGEASAPELTLSSSPELPQDEILARLLFDRDLTEITILQAAKMAAAVATLTGGGGGLVSKIRDGFDLDDIDFSTTEEGVNELKVGKYLSDNIYSDVTVDSTGKSEINLNLDASEHVTFKGSMGSDGSTGLGVFFEKDY